MTQNFPNLNTDGNPGFSFTGNKGEKSKRTTFIWTDRHFVSIEP